MFYLFSEKKIFLYKVFNFPTPGTLNSYWNMGFLLFLFLGVQIFTGVFLSFFINGGSLCLDSKFHVYKEIGLGWLLVSLHDMLPNYIFLFMYLHMFKSILFPTHSIFSLWLSGVLLLLLFMGVSFTGYSLVGSSMGYWASTVIGEILSFVFGMDFSSLVLFSQEVGFSNSVWTKLFTIHYTLSFLGVGAMGAHIHSLHKFGSSGFGFSNCESFSFLEVIFFKDILIGGSLVMCFLYSVFFVPEIFYPTEGSVPMESKDFVEMSVEWYLSIFFTLLSSLEDKSFGIILMFLLVLLVLFIVFFKSLWGLWEGSIFLLVFLLAMTLILVSFYVFSSSLSLISLMLVFLINIFLENILIMFYFLSYLPMKS